MKTTKELYLTDLVLECAVALQTGDFKTARRVNTIILFHYKEDFIGYHMFNQFPYLMTKYKRFIPYHDLYFCLRYLVQSMGLNKTDDFQHLAPFVVE